MQERIDRYNQGVGPRPRGLPPPQRFLSSQFEFPHMLDTTGLIVDAAYVTVPASVWRYLQEHRNPRTVDGEYKTIRRYTQEKDRKRALANICRQYWFRARGKGRTNRFTWEPYHQYLTMPLVGQLVQFLVNEFGCRSSK